MGSMTPHNLSRTPDEFSTLPSRARSDAPSWPGYPYRPNPDRGTAAIWSLGVAGAFLIVMGLVWMFSQKTLAVLSVYPLAAGLVVCGVVCVVGATVIAALR